MPKIVIENCGIENTQELGVLDLVYYLMRYSYMYTIMADVSSSFLKEWGVKLTRNVISLQYCKNQIKSNKKKTLFENEVLGMTKTGASKIVNWVIFDDRGDCVIMKKEIEGGISMMFRVYGTIDSIKDGECYVIDHDAVNIYSITKETGNI